LSTLGKLRDRAMQQGMKLMSDPRFMKLMSSPQAQKMMMLAFRLPGKIEGAFAAQGERFARRFKLATREEVERLNATIRDLERSLSELEAKQSKSSSRRD
jgi:hypothetical protein